MVVDSNHPPLRAFLGREGFFVDRMSDARNTTDWKGKKQVALPTQPGRADIVVSRNGRTAAIEVKAGSPAPDYRNFPISEWREEQRAWAKKWTEYGNKHFMFITVGSRVQSAPTVKNRFPKLSVLLPYQVMLDIEYQLDRKSIPYDLFEGLQSTWGCPWFEGTWTIPKSIYEFWSIFE